MEVTLTTETIFKGIEEVEKWDSVDLTKVRRRVEDRLRKDDLAVKLTAVLLNIKLEE